VFEKSTPQFQGNVINCVEKVSATLRCALPSGWIIFSAPGAEEIGSVTHHLIPGAKMMPADEKAISREQLAGASKTTIFLDHASKCYFIIITRARRACGPQMIWDTALAREREIYTRLPGSVA
jgi:hypothetical protein